MDFEEIEKKASQSHGEIVELKALVRQMQARMERQVLVIQVLKDMLLAGDKAAEKDFLERLQAAATRKLDGNACHACGKAMSPKHNRCIYCGADRPPELL